MEVAFAEGYQNPVGSHHSECVQLWSMLRFVMPNLAKSVNTLRVYEILANHDNGELVKGDLSLHAQANGQVDNKKIEIAQVKALARKLPTDLRHHLVQDIIDFEAATDQPVSLEIRLARLIDSLQGNLVCLTKGQNLADPNNNIAKILHMRVIPRTQALIQQLRVNGKNQAAAEVLELGRYHLNEYRKLGINIEISAIK